MTAKNSRPDPTAHKNTDLAKNTAAADPAAESASKPASKPARGRPGFELSATQIIAGTAAAMTAALLGSRLGIAGTILGAALGSVISIVAGAVYSHSIVSARHRVRALTQRDDPTARLLIGLPTAPISASGDLPMVTEPLRPSRASRPRRPTPRRPLRGVLVGTVAGAAVFVGALAVITGIETVKGTPLSGGGVGGLTVLGGSPLGDPDPGSVPVPTKPTISTTPPAAGSVGPTASDPVDGGPDSDVVGAGSSSDADARTRSTATSATSATQRGGSIEPSISPSAGATRTTIPTTTGLPASSLGSSPTSGGSPTPPTGSSAATNPSATTAPAASVSESANG